MVNVPDLGEVFNWFVNQIQWVFLIAFVGGVCVFVWKRSFIGLLIFFIFSLIIGIFILDPEIMLELPGRVRDMLKIG